MCKKFLAVLLAAVMLLSMFTVTAAAAEPGAAYTDTAGHWAEKAIDRWSAYGIVTGYKDGTFLPNGYMKRGEVAQVISQLLGLTTKAENSFSDLTGSEWYANAVLKCRAAGIMVGTGGRCNATANITREEAFAMIARALGVKPSSNTSVLDKFTDASSISNYAKSSLAALVSAGYVSGVGNNQMQPGAYIDRASVMQILNATIGTYANAPGNYTSSGSGMVLVNTDGNVSISGNTDGIMVSQGAKGSSVNVSNSMIDGNVKVDAADSTVTFSNSKVGSVSLSPSASNSKLVVNPGSTVDTVTTSADNVTISGDGEVKDVQVEDGSNVAVNTPGTNVTVDDDAGTVTAGGQTVAPGSDTTTAGTGEGYDAAVGGGSDGSSVGGGGSSAVASAVTVAPAAALLNWTNEPALDYMKVTSFAKSGVTYTAAGSLKYHSGFTGFNNKDTTEQAGWYAAVDVTIPSDVLAAAKEVNDVIFTLPGETNKTFTGADFKTENTDTVTLYLLVSKDGSTKKNFTFKVDWDGAGTAYDETTYTLNFQSVNLIYPAYTITVDADGGTASAPSVTTGDNGKLAALPTATKAGYTFVKWVLSTDTSTEVTIDTLFKAHTTIKAVWEEAAQEDTTDYPIPVAGIAADHSGLGLTNVVVNPTIDYNATTGEVTLGADSITYHMNDASTKAWGYWIGFGLKAPNGATKIQVSMASSEGDLATFNDSTTKHDLVDTVGDGLGAYFYADAGSATPNKFVKVQWWSNTAKVGVEKTYEMVLPAIPGKLYQYTLNENGVLDPLDFKAKEGDEPYALAYGTKLDVLADTSIIVQAEVDSTVVWKEQGTASTAKKTGFTWSLHNLNATLIDGYTATGNDAVIYEQDDQYIIPVNTVITFTVTVTKGSLTSKMVYKHTMSTADVTKVTMPTTYTITYKANYGSITDVTETKTDGVNYTIAGMPDGFAREGWAFVGWTTTEGGTTANSTYNVGATYSADEALTLYAVWVQPVATFDAFMVTHDMGLNGIVTKLQEYFPSLTETAYLNVYGGIPYEEYPWVFVVFKQGSDSNLANYPDYKATLSNLSFTATVGGQEQALNPTFKSGHTTNLNTKDYCNNISFYVNGAGAGDESNCNDLHYAGDSTNITVTLTVGGVVYTKTVAYTKPVTP